jgi:hypothetical protein
MFLYFVFGVSKANLAMAVSNSNNTVAWLRKKLHLIVVRLKGIKGTKASQLSLSLIPYPLPSL